MRSSTALILALGVCSPLTRAFGANAFIPNSTPGFRQTENYVAPTLIKVGRTALDGALNDYPSARFRYVFAHFTSGGGVGKNKYAGGWFFCGQLNAKNQLGGYGGWKAFLLLGTRVFTNDLDEDNLAANEPFWNLCGGYNSLISQYDPTHDYAAELTFRQ